VQESSASAPPTFFLPLWARIALACFMFAVSALTMWDKFFQFDWVGLLCLGLFYLLHVSMQKGEARKAYFHQASNDNLVYIAKRRSRRWAHIYTIYSRSTASGSCRLSEIDFTQIPSIYCQWGQAIFGIFLFKVLPLPCGREIAAEKKDREHDERRYDTFPE